jgi:hypothetical protein
MAGEHEGNDRVAKLDEVWIATALEQKTELDLALGRNPHEATSARMTPSARVTAVKNLPCMLSTSFQEIAPFYADSCNRILSPASPFVSDFGAGRARGRHSVVPTKSPPPGETAGAD